MRNFLFIFLFLSTLACEQATQKQKIRSPEEQAQLKRKDFEEYVKIISDEDTLNKTLIDLKYTPVSVYAYCLQLSDPLVIARLVKSVYLSANNNNQTAARSDFWADIRYDMYSFTQLVAGLREPEDSTFLDIGCGSGQKMYAALCMHFAKVYGLEYSQESYEYAKTFLGDFIKNKKIEIEKGDALTIDGKYYATADFLYTYSPIKDNELMAKLFHRAIENMKEGAIMLEVRMVYASELKKLSRLSIPNSRGYFAVKKKGGKYFYKNIGNPYDWVELNKI
jgi:SAM-dependent methyltransferase